MPRHLSSRWRGGTDSALHTGTNQDRFLSSVPVFLASTSKNRLYLHCMLKRRLLLLCLKFGILERIFCYPFAVPPLRMCSQEREAVLMFCKSDHAQLSEVDSEKSQCGAEGCAFISLQWVRPLINIYFTRQSKSEGNTFRLQSVQPVLNISGWFCHMCWPKRSIFLDLALMSWKIQDFTG